MRLFTKFHPVLSIILGIIAAIIFFGISTLAVGVTAWSIWITILFGLINGGFTITHFTKEKRIKYRIYAGIIFATTVIVNFGKPPQYNIIGYNVLLFVFFSVIAINGGCIEEISHKKTEFNVDKHLKDLWFSKYNRRIIQWSLSNKLGCEYYEK